MPRHFLLQSLGIDAYLIEVEVDVSVGMSVFNIVGLPDSTIKESRDRILSAVNNSGYSFPVRRVVVNLALARNLTVPLSKQH